MRLASALFAALLAASLIAAALVVRAKTPDLMVEITQLPGHINDPDAALHPNHGFSPNGDGERDVAKITLFIRADEPHATVEIVGRFLKPIRTLAADVPLRENERVHYEWDGRTDDGSRAPPGRYRVRVILPTLDRDVVDLRRIALVRG